MLLMGFLLNAYWGLGYSFKELAETFTDRITVEQAARLGYDRESGSIEDWYNRSWRTTQRLLNLIDPWHETRHLGRTLTGAENAQARARYDKAREERSHVLSALLVRASLLLLPKKYLDGYRGDVALDSTFLQVRGFINPNDYSKKARRARKGLPLRDMLNVDYQCGWYTREGDHNSADHKHSRPGYEIDTPVMIDTRDGNFPFPSSPDSPCTDRERSPREPAPRSSSMPRSPTSADSSSSTARSTTSQPTSSKNPFGGCASRPCTTIASTSLALRASSRTSP